MERKILFDKVEVKIIDEVHSETEKKLIIPVNQHIQRGVVTQVGDGVKAVEEGNIIEFLSISKNDSFKDLYYIREREILFIFENENKKVTIDDWIYVEKVKEEVSKDSLLTNLKGKNGVLQKAKVVYTNSNSGFKKEDVIFYKEKIGERVMFNNTDHVMLRDSMVVYKEEKDE